MDAAGGVDAFRISPVDDPAGQVKLVDAVVDDVSAGVVPEPVPGVVEVVLVERPRRSGAEPAVVVDTRRHGPVGPLADARAGLAVEHANEVDLAELAGPDVVDGPLDIQGAAALRADLDNPVELPCGADHLPRFPDAVAGRLLDIDVLAGLAGPDGSQGMPVVGRGDHEGVDGFVIEHVTDVLDGFRRSPAELRGLGGALGQAAGINIGEIRNRDVGPLAEALQQVVAAATHTHEAEHDPIIGRHRPTRSGAGSQRRQ